MGNRPLVHLFAEGIACDLYVRSVNGREKSRTYELVISNKTVIEIACRTYGIDAIGHTRESGMLAIGKQSAGNSFFSLRFETGDQQRLFVEVVGEGVSVFAEALQPKAQANRPWPRSAFALAIFTSAITIGTTVVKRLTSASNCAFRALGLRQFPRRLPDRIR